MIDPSLAVQKSIVATLKADAGVIAAFGGAAKVYDRVPVGAVEPYIRVGGSQTLDDAAEGVAGAESFETVHVWSPTVGKVQAKTIAKAVAAALDDEITIEGHHLIVWECERIDHLDGGDGLTSHSVLAFRYETEPA